MSGTVRQNSSRRRTVKPQPWRRRGIFRGQKIKRKGEDRPGQGADIADQDGLAEQRQPFLPAPEPLADIGPDPRAALQRGNAIEIADEVSDLGDERPEIDLRADRSDDQRREEHRRSQRQPQALARDRLAIGVVQHRQLLLGKHGNGDGHCSLHRALAGRNGKRPGRADPASVLVSADAQDAFFLRRLSTNLIRSIMPSQSLVVAGLKAFFWPSDRRSNAALSLVGAVRERLGDRGLQVGRQFGVVGIGPVEDRRRLVDDPEIILLHRRAVGVLQHALVSASAPASNRRRWSTGWRRRRRCPAPAPAWRSHGCR